MRALPIVAPLLAAAVVLASAGAPPAGAADTLPRAGDRGSAEEAARQILAEVSRALGHDDAAAAAKRAERLRALGPAAAPALVAALGTRVGPTAMDALVDLGPAAAPVLPRLLERLAEPEISAQAATALAAIGPAAAGSVPRIIEIGVAHPDWRCTADEVGAKSILLASFGPAALPHLERLLRSDDPWAQELAAEAWVRIPEPTLASLERHLRHPEASVRYEALVALADERVLDREGLARRFATALASDPSPRVRALAAGRVPGSWIEGVGVPELLVALADPDGGVRSAAASSLGAIGRDHPRQAEIAAALTRVLSDPEAGWAAGWALGEIEASPGGGRSDLAQQVRDLSGREVPRSLARAYASSLPQTVERLTAELEHESPAVRIEVARAIAALGEDGNGAFQAPQMGV